MVVDGRRNGSASVGGGESPEEERGGESGSSSHCVKEKVWESRMGWWSWIRSLCVWPRGVLGWWYLEDFREGFMLKGVG